MEIISNDLILAIVITGMGLIVTVLSIIYSSSGDIKHRIDTFVEIPRDPNTSYTLSDPIERGFSGSLFRRTVANWFKSTIAVIGRSMPLQSVQETNRRLELAGNPFNFQPQQYYGFRLLVLMGMMLLSFLFYLLNPTTNSLLAGLLISIIAILVPDLWLRTTIKNRQLALERSLPDALDVLCICVSAGLSFDQSLQRVGHTFDSAIGYEFSRIVSEIELGVSRRDAFRNLQRRVNLPQVSSFIAVILQSESHGMSIADVLQIQADQMRVERQYRAKEIAQRLPAKMMVPLALLIFPALFAILLGPMLPYLQELLGSV